MKRFYKTNLCMDFITFLNVQMGDLPKKLNTSISNIYSNIFHKICLVLIISWKYLVFSVFHDIQKSGIVIDVVKTVQKGKEEANTTI